MKNIELDHLWRTNKNAFLKAASRQYGINEKNLATLLSDYDLVSKHTDQISLNDAVPGSLTEIAKEVDLPVKVLGRLQYIKVIGKPITWWDWEFLIAYRKVWRNIFLLRTQLAKFSQKQREDLIFRPELSNKWERWVYAKYFFNEIQYGHGGRMMTPERRIFINVLATQVEEIFHVPDCPNTRNQILEIRQMANNDRKKVSQGKATERAVLRSRGLPETELELWQDTFVFDMYS